MGIGEWLIFTFMITLIFLAAGKSRGNSTPKKRSKSEEDIERLRQMQEWDRISHGEDKNRK